MTTRFSAQLLVWLATAFSSPALVYAQAGLLRGPTRVEIVGAWELVPTPSSLQPNFFRSDPWPMPCQYFRYFEDGRLFTVMMTPAPCKKMNNAELDELRLVVADPPEQFQYLTSQDDASMGFLIVTRSDVPKYEEIWLPQMVTADTVRRGVQYRKGDLLLTLQRLPNPGPIWIRHLRRITE